MYLTVHYSVIECVYIVESIIKKYNSDSTSIFWAGWPLHAWISPLLQDEINAWILATQLYSSQNSSTSLAASESKSSWRLIAPLICLL